MKKTIELVTGIVFVLLVALIIYGGYSYILFPKTMVAHASNGKIINPANLVQPQSTELNTRTGIGAAKIYLKAVPINVTFESSRWTANRTEILSWLNSGTINPSSFVNLIANQVNTAPTASTNGRSVDTNNLTNQINDALTSGRPNKTIALVTSVVSYNTNAQAGRYSGRYIDVNLSEQTLYAFEGYNLINQFLVSTGRAGYATPTGEFYIYGKTGLQKMSGPGYYLPNVPNISWFSGDYSIHGTYWHNNFGHPMSHGCINASIPDAEWIFNWDDIGTPVFIHY